MPAYGLVPDSPWLYGAKKAARGFGRRRPRGRRVSSFTRVVVTTSVLMSVKFHELRIYDAELHSVLNTPRGSLWRELDQAADRAVLGAKAMAGYKTGKLKKSIHKRHLGNFTGQYVWIGSRLPYAYAHHEGTKPHKITAEPGGVLVFGGTKSFKGRVIKTPTVNHPGNRPNPYLRTQLAHFRPLIS